MAGPVLSRRVRSASSSSSSSSSKRRSNEMTAASKGKGKQRAMVQDEENEDDEQQQDISDEEEDAAAAGPGLVVSSHSLSAPPPPPSILVVKGSSSSSSRSIGKSNSDNDSGEDVDVDVDAFDAATKRDDGLLAPLLKYLPTGKSMDIPGLRKLLGAVHPSAFGAFKSKEAWRRDNPDVLYAAYAGRHQESCGAHSPPNNNNSCNAMEDLFDEELDWDKEDEDDSDGASVSSLAELGAQTPKETTTLPPEGGPSKLAIYLSKPPEEQKRLARISSSSPSGLSASASSSSAASSFSVSGSASGRLPPHSPTQLGIGPSKLRRQASNSSLATSSSACTCTSAASRSSSISFAALPDTEDLRLHRKSRRGERSSSMGIAGRRNLLLGKSSSSSRNSSDPALDEEDLFDRLEGLKEEEGFGDDLGFQEDDEDIARLRRANESSLRVNEDGELVEKRPLGVTLEDLNLPMKRTKHTRGRPRNTSTDLSTAFGGIPSSPPALTGARPLLAPIHPPDGSSTGLRSFSSPPTLVTSLPLASPRSISGNGSQQNKMAGEGDGQQDAVTAASRTLQRYVDGVRKGEEYTAGISGDQLDFASQLSRTAAEDAGNSPAATPSDHGSSDQPPPGSPPPHGYTQSSSSGSDEKTPCSTPRFERLDLAFTSSSSRSLHHQTTTTSPPSSSSASADHSFSEITPSATPRCGSPTRGWRMTSTTCENGSAGHTRVPEGLAITSAAAADGAVSLRAKDAEEPEVGAAGASDITVIGSRQRDTEDPESWLEDDEIDESPLANAGGVDQCEINTATGRAVTEEADTSPDLVHDLASSPSPSWSSPESPSSDDDNNEEGAYSEVEDEEEDRDSLKKERRNGSLVPTLLRGRTGGKTKKLGAASGTTGVRVHMKKKRGRAPSFGKANPNRTVRVESA